MSDSPASVYGTLLQLGYTVLPCGERLQVFPDNLPPALLERLVRQRDGVLALAKMAQRHQGDAETLAGLRAFLPGLWEPVSLPSGEIGILWGVTARTVLVQPFPSGPITGYSPAEVHLVGQGPRRL